MNDTIWKNAGRAAAMSGMLFFGMSAMAGAAEEPATEPATQAAASVDKPAVNWGQLATKAYDRSQKVTTTAECTALLKDIEAVLALQPSGEFNKYFGELSGWTHNKRGELLAVEAGKLAAAGQRDEAASADAAALADFTRAIELNAKDWKAWHNRGVSHGQLRKLPEALADFSKVIELNKGYANAYFNRGEIYLETGNHHAAFTDYTRALELNPNDAAIHVSRGHMYARAKMHREALADYARATQLGGGSATLDLDRADSHAALGDYTEAAPLYREAMASAKTGRAYRSGAWFLATCPDGRYRNGELALTAAKRAIELDGEQDYRYLHTLAVAQYAAGQKDEARKTLERAISEAPSSDTAEKLSEQLAAW